MHQLLTSAYSAVTFTFDGFSVFEGVAQGQAEVRGFNFEHIAVFCLHTIGEGERCRTEHMHMDVARLAEDSIFEVMMFEICDGVGHVVFTGQEWLFPNGLVFAQDT